MWMHAFRMKSFVSLRRLRGSILSASVLALCPFTTAAQEPPTGLERESSSIRTEVSGSEYPSYLVVVHFVSLGKPFLDMESDPEWSVHAGHAMPSPWETEFLEPLGIEPGADLDFALRETVHELDTVLFAPVPSVSAGDERSREDARRAEKIRKMRTAAEIVADFLDSYETAEHEMARFFEVLDEKVRPVVSMTFTSTPDEVAEMTPRERLRRDYVLFDREIERRTGMRLLSRQAPGAAERAGIEEKGR